MLPNFLIVGAAKAGTTALYYHLKSHPQIFMSPVKEPRYFSSRGGSPAFTPPPGLRLPLTTTVASDDEYRALFKKVTSERAVGEASTHYLYAPEAAERIQLAIPAVRLVAVLRNPVERAYSNYLHQVREGLEPAADFLTSLAEEKERIALGWPPFWHYAARGLYHAQLTRYYERFDRRQIRVYLYDDFAADPASLMRDLFEFLEVDTSFVPDLDRRYNESGVPKSRRFRSWIRKPFTYGLVPNSVRTSALAQRAGAMLNRLSLAKPPMPVEAREQLSRFFRDDILALQELIGRDLSAWLRH
jgi:hypothetical protein